MGTSRRLRTFAQAAISGPRPAGLGLVLVIGWMLGSACTGGGTVSTGGAGGSTIDWGGTTGSGDEMLNGDVEAEPDPTDPTMPDCGPEAVLDDQGNCVPSCDVGNTLCADDDPTACDGLTTFATYECAACCTLPDGDPGCPPEGCDEADCPPGEDCSYTDTCPDGECGAGEDCSTCPLDCGECAGSCGDGYCDEGKESCSSCPEDCGDCGPMCGNGTCETDSESCETCPRDCGHCLKVLTWDIGAGLRHGKSRVKKTLKGMASLIAKEKPHLVGLQSVDKNTKRSGQLDEALYIARRVKMWKRFGAAFKYDGGQHGLAFLSKHPIIQMEKLSMPTSGEWAKRRIVLTATVAPPDYYTDFGFHITSLAKKDAPRLAQATAIAKKIGFTADAMLVGDFAEGPTGAAVKKLQADMNLLDLFPKFGEGSGLTTKKSRQDYVMAAFNWWNLSAEGQCATVVRAYVKPAKGLSSHRPVIALFQQGFTGIDCGATGDSGGETDGILDSGDSECVQDEDCAEMDPYRFCLEGYCSECRDGQDCLDPEAPTCDESHTCF